MPEAFGLGAQAKRARSGWPSWGTSRWPAIRTATASS